MNKHLYIRLALQNIKKTHKLYIPYFITGIFTVAAFYNMLFVTYNDNISTMPGSQSLRTIMGFGSIVVGIFAVVFLLYTNSFLMKRRQKELGLYSILGMGKMNIARILCYETLFSCLISVSAGLLLGILLSKALMMVIFKFLFFKVNFGFQVSVPMIVVTLILFCAIFFLSFASNVVRVGRLKPIDLLHGSETGEKEPKSKWLLCILGLISLGVGYAIAIVNENPIAAVFLFFIAVIFVIIGTYFLFTAGSITLLKLMRKKKSYYYTTKHFISVSGMLYRMKRNAVGLANICVLSTMVLVMISTTVCLYIGAESSLVSRYPREISAELINCTPEDEARFAETCNAVMKERGLAPENVRISNSVTIYGVRQGKNIVFSNDSGKYSVSDMCYTWFTTVDAYNKYNKTNYSLSGNEVIARRYSGSFDSNTLTVAGKEIKISKWEDSMQVTDELQTYVCDTFCFIVSDELFDYVNNAQHAAYGSEASNVKWYYGFDVAGDDEEQTIEIKDDIKSAFTVPKDGDMIAMTECRYSYKEDFYGAYGGFLFLGIFLGTLFVMATVMIIYYKQITEGYEDKQRFEIMQKVGLRRTEIKKSIRSQMLCVFFLPLIAALVHLVAAFKMITKLLLLFALTDVGLFAICCVVTFAVFAAVYFLVYSLTAKAYYKIVK